MNSLGAKVILHHKSNKWKKLPYETQSHISETPKPKRSSEPNLHPYWLGRGRLQENIISFDI